MCPESPGDIVYSGKLIERLTMKLRLILKSSHRISFVVLLTIKTGLLHKSSEDDSPGTKESKDCTDGLFLFDL